MSLFSRNKDTKIRGLMLKLANTKCPEMRPQLEDPRFDSRANVTIAVIVIPIENGQIQVARAFKAITKDISSIGMGIILDHPIGLDEAILGFRVGTEMSFARAEAKHLNPLGGGFFQLGFRMWEVISPGDFPELANMSI
jgi:hypothetical protein